jgi:hypothetical protein
VHIDRQRNALGLQDAGLGVCSVWPLAVVFGIATAWIMLQAQSITPSAWHHPLSATAAQTSARRDPRMPLRIETPARCRHATAATAVDVGLDEAGNGAGFHLRRPGRRLHIPGATPDRRTHL